MANIYALFFAVAASSSLMAAYGDPSSNAMNPGTNPAYNQGTNPSMNNNRMNNNATAPDYRVNVQRDSNANAQSAYSNQSTYAQKSVNGDAQVLSQIQDRIKGAYKQYNINVNVSNGIATLTGSVNSQLDKDAIEKDVRNVPGITKVNNQLNIQR